jgi:hypothetical protein
MFPVGSLQPVRHAKATISHVPQATLWTLDEGPREEDEAAGWQRLKPSLADREQDIFPKLGTKTVRCIPPPHAAADEQGAAVAGGGWWAAPGHVLLSVLSCTMGVDTSNLAIAVLLFLALGQAGEIVWAFEPELGCPRLGSRKATESVQSGVPWQIAGRTAKCRRRRGHVGGLGKEAPAN